MYEDERAFLERVEDGDDATNDRELFREEKIAALVQEHEGLPEEFLNYLREIGAGSFLECQFVVYGWLSTVDDIIDTNLIEASRLLAFGDDFMGDHYGFLPSENWKLAYLCHASGELHTLDESFREFISERILVDESMEDGEGEGDEIEQAVMRPRSKSGCLGVALLASFVWLLAQI